MIDQTADIMLLEKMFSKPRIARYVRGVKSDVIPENNKNMPHKKPASLRVFYYRINTQLILASSSPLA